LRDMTGRCGSRRAADPRAGARPARRRVAAADPADCRTGRPGPAGCAPPDHRRRGTCSRSAIASPSTRPSPSTFAIQPPGSSGGCLNARRQRTSPHPKQG
jgi:hypothetical protein